jgi:UDP-N-acetylglucosamine--N-acetylmuramyl-(pentapeptide) pyrophosphoryl-undecaprenol N-acetylglucosamine transferase
MKIMLTGGGTAGHVMPNLALVPHLREDGFDISYIGSKAGMEKELVENAGLPYFGISSGKLRRYLSLKNLTDGFRVLKGIGEARKIIKKAAPDVIFSKGGFVAVPVVYAAKMLKVPVVIHESDITVGLANRLAIPHATKVCCVFPETLRQIPAVKGILTGTPIREEVLTGSRIKGAAFCNFADEKPVILVMGGSQGSAIINTHVRGALDVLLPHFNIIHSCGRGNLDSTINRAGYMQMEYINENMGDFYALADIVVSRAGANSIGEFLALAKPNVLIPLSRKASRGDQILNAASFEKQGFSVVIDEEELTEQFLVEVINQTYADRGKYAANMKKAGAGDGIGQIVDIIKEVAKK